MRPRRLALWATALLSLHAGCKRGAASDAPITVRSEMVLGEGCERAFARVEVRTTPGARASVYGGSDPPAAPGLPPPSCGDAPCAREALVDAAGVAVLRVQVLCGDLVGASTARRRLQIDVSGEGVRGMATHALTPPTALVPFAYGLAATGRAGSVALGEDGAVGASDLPPGAELRVDALPPARAGADGRARVAMDPAQALAAMPLDQVTRPLEDPNGSGLLWTQRLQLEAASGGGHRVTLRYPDGASLEGRLSLRPALAETMLAARARGVEGVGIAAPGRAGAAVLVVWRDPQASGGGMAVAGRAARLGEVGRVAVLERVAQPVACGRYAGVGGGVQVNVTETHLDAAVFARDTGALVTRRRFAAPPARCPGSVFHRRGESASGVVGSTAVDETAAAQWLRALAAGTAEAAPERPSRRRRRR
jgi:hypothetical protein